MRRSWFHGLIALVAVLGVAHAAPAYGEAPRVELVSEGEAKLPIVIGANADASVEAAAEELATYLERISGVAFEVRAGDGSTGLVLGMPEDFDALPMDEVSFGTSPFERDDYLLRSTGDGLYLLGATPVAAQFAMWDLLHRFGHRQFFPMSTWEVVPEHEELAIAIDVYEQPDYYVRRGPRGPSRLSRHPWHQDDWRRWTLRNRTADESFALNTGHALHRVRGRHEEVFEQHPEYNALIDGERDGRRYCISNEDLRALMVQDALDRVGPDTQSISMDPRDVGPWCECEPCAEMGTPSDRIVILANEVAEAINEGREGYPVYVGIYGYKYHSPPPQVDVHPFVIPSLVTGFIREGYTFSEMIDGWSERAEMFGIREFYGLTVWHSSMPGQGNASDPAHLAETTAHWHDRGARFMNAQSDYNWGGNGLGYYLASRFLWDVEETQRMDELVDDFLTKAFGPAEEPMRAFYEVIDRGTPDRYVPSRRQPLNEDRIGRMYRHLAEARELAADEPAVKERIDDLILYTRYADLFQVLERTEGEGRQAVFDEFATFAWRIRERAIADSVNMFSHLNRFFVNRDDNLSWPEGGGRLSPADIHRENEDVPHDEEEILAILADGIERNEVLELDFEPWTDSGEWVPAGFEPDERGRPIERWPHRGDVEMVVHTDDSTLPRLWISAGHIYDDRGPVRWQLRDLDGTVLDEGGAAPDEEKHHFELTAPSPGLYRLSITNTGQGFHWGYEARGAKLTLLGGGEHALRRNYFNRLYFYVPADMRDIYIAGTLREGRHEFIAGDGEAIDPEMIEINQGFTRIPVPEGQDAALWSVTTQVINPTWRFLNIPGYLAFSPDELILPAEVVEQLP